MAPLPEDGIYAAYALLADASAEGTVPLARVIVAAGQACPTLASQSGPLAMIARQNPNPTTFPVEVCEARYPFGEAMTVTGTKLALPAIERKPQRIIVLGDTGCNSGSNQDCNDRAAWPFAAFAAAAAQDRPDLVIHLGDYNYRGTPGTIEVNGESENVYDVGDSMPKDMSCQFQAPYVSQNAADSPVPDNWSNWWADFFAPAAPLLARAPWVFVRGNHDLCSRAGPGYFYFLDPHSSLLAGGSELSCPVQQNGGGPLPNLVFVPPYRLDLGRLNLVVLDSANACDLYANFPETYAQQFEAVRQLAATNPTWLVGHRPLWAANQGDSASGPVQVINVALQQALRDSSLDGSLPPAVQLVLAGHMHRFEAVTFASARCCP